VTAFPKDDQAALRAFYGDVGTQQVRLQLPYSMVLAWDPGKKINSLLCHARVHDSLRNIFANTLQHFGLQRVQALSLDQFGGCLNVRPRRGGSSYSVHAWGAAVDLDPVNNALRWDRSRAAFARAEYEPFWKIVEEQGWTSLGRQRDYDWMHFQAASL